MTPIYRSNMSRTCHMHHIQIAMMPRDLLNFGTSDHGSNHLIYFISGNLYVILFVATNVYAASVPHISFGGDTAAQDDLDQQSTSNAFATSFAR